MIPFAPSSFLFPEVHDIIIDLNGISYLVSRSPFWFLSVYYLMHKPFNHQLTSESVLIGDQIILFNCTRRLDFSYRFIADNLNIHIDNDWDIPSSHSSVLFDTFYAPYLPLHPITPENPLSQTDWDNYTLHDNICAI